MCVSMASFDTMGPTNRLLGGSSHDCKWLMTTFSFRPLRIGLFPFQMAIHGLYIGVTNYLPTGISFRPYT